MSKLFIISGPSGAGEDSIIKKLKNIFNFEKIVTTTTREKRPHEEEGKDYYFIKRDEFEKGIKNNVFFEWALQYNNNLYGVTHKEIERVKNSNNIGIWKIEYQGVIEAKKKMGDSIITILINAPQEQLTQRLIKRDNPSTEFLNERIEYNKEWMKNKTAYDFEINNKDGKLEESVEKVANIIKNNLT